MKSYGKHDVKVQVHGSGYLVEDSKKIIFLRPHFYYFCMVFGALSSKTVIPKSSNHMMGTV
jgi:hypothetical protein